MAAERLDKLLASMGRWSRRDARRMVGEGRVLVDGAVARSAEEKCDPLTSAITVDGQPFVYRRYTYLMLHKPSGVLSATEDGAGRTVLDLLPKEYAKMGLAPVGRLDKDTEGLLLLTNDGPTAHRLLSPKSHVDKVYLARIEGRLSADAEAEFAAGMTLGDGTKCLPAVLERLDGETVRVTLHEGKYHQVKRMIARCGAEVTALKRLAMGNLRLDPSLAPGRYRLLTGEEIDALLSAAGQGLSIK